jgi:uncharacterized protein (TIGR02147 family)
MPSPDYRDQLKDEYLSRSRGRPQYSLRAFARDIGISASRVSELFQKKNHLSTRLAFQIAEKLSLNAKESERFCNMVAARSARNLKQRKTAQRALRGERLADLPMRLTDSDFSPLSDWFYLVLIELASQNQLTKNYSKFAKILGLSELQVRLACEKLLAAKFLSEDGKNLRATHRQLFAGDQGPSAVIRKFHEQFLEVARMKLNSLPFTEKDFNVRYLSLTDKQFEQLKVKIRAWLDEMLEEGGKNPADTEIYAIGLQSFKLTNSSQ